MQRRKSFIVVVCVIVCSLLLSALPAAAASKPKPGKGAGVDPPASLGFTVASWLADKALGAVATHAFGFLFTQLGIDGPSPELKALEDIKRQLDQISGQIATVQESLDALNTKVLKNALDSQLIGLRNQINTVEDVFNFQFRPVLSDVVTLANRRKNNDTKEQIAKAVTALEQDRAKFIDRFDNNNVGSMVKNIHDALVPGTATSVLSAMGQLLLSQRRYLTTQTSRDIRTLFDGLRQSEALAAYMKMERYIPANPDDPDANWDLWELARTQFLAYNVQEFRYLPPVIPADVVIDAGPVATLRTSTNNVTMLLPAPDFGAVPARPSANGNPIDAATARVNVGFRATFSDWQIASQANLTGLLGGFEASKAPTPAAYLSALNPTNPVWQSLIEKGSPWNHIWSRDSINQKVTCNGLSGGEAIFGSATFPTNMAVAVGGTAPVWSPRPKFTDQTTNRPDPDKDCRIYGEAQFAGPNASARVMMARSTGTMRMDYAATGGDFNITAGADLRNADLTSFNLGGVDLKGVNLVGATLLGTILAKAKLTDADLAGAHFDFTDLTGADLTNANLAGVSSVGIRGVPAALPVGWRLIGGVLVGPGADLRQRDLTGLDLRTVDLTGVISGETDCTGCLLPPGWAWSGLSGGYLVGPGAVLPNADLRNADLRAARLDGANLSGANLGGADLTGVSLKGATLSNAVLAGARLSGANLTDANLTGADLTGALLPGATLVRAAMSRTTLTGANLAGADLTDANLSNAVMRGSVFTNARLGGANLTGADLTDAVGRGAGLAGANLTQAVVIGADLYGADLRTARLRLASFSQSNLGTADLTGADLTSANTYLADLSGATLTRVTVTGANLGGRFDGVTSSGIVGTPASLTSAWRLIDGFLIGRGANARTANVTGANLTGLDLTGADFTGAILTNVNFTNATLVNVVLNRATVGGTTFATDNDNKLAGMVSGGLVGTPRTLPSSGRFRLVQGYLVGPSANLSGAVFTSTAQLGVSLSGTNFTNASLVGVNLTGATMTNAILANARLTDANLTNVSMSAANLKGVSSGGIRGTPALPTGYQMLFGFIAGPEVNLSGADVGGIRFTAMNLTRANFAGADLSEADFRFANLTGANLTGANLTGAVWGQTTCPNGVVQRSACSPLVLSSPPTVSAIATANGGAFAIDVDPNLVNADWEFTIERLTESGGWMPLGSDHTRGSDETASANLRAGTYRVVVPQQRTSREATSAVVVLTK